MGKLFLSVLNMSLMASYVILFVILVRLLLRKASKAISYALWGVVAFRLIIPFSFESMFSFLPRSANIVPIPHDIIYQQSPQINSGIEVVDLFVSKSLPAPMIGASVNPLQIYTEIGAYMWILGIMVLLIYSVVSVLQLKRQLKSAQLIEQNIFEAKNLKTPFVLGLIRPKIYLPLGLNVEERGYILLHEQTHIHRKDHITKVLAYLILSIHWFNPLVWIAFMLMSTDMELSCDESVLKEMNEDIKKPYASSLLSLAAGGHILNGSPLAFGEGNVKGRIKNVLNYRKPRFWVVVASVISVAAVSIGLLGNPINTAAFSEVVGLTLKPVDRTAYGTLISENKHMDFNEAKAEEIADYLRELKVNKSPVSQSRDLDRDNTNQIHFVFRGLYNGDRGNIYFNFSKNFSEVWVNDDVKPSLSYTVKKPGEVKAFFERQFGSVTAAMEIGSAAELWKARTKYIGDNSAVGK
ncbi:MAG: M56 family metallopeptidase, partial [Thermotaleaceae bacterium]